MLFRTPRTRIGIRVLYEERTKTRHLMILRCESHICNVNLISVIFAVDIPVISVTANMQLLFVGQKIDLRCHYFVLQKCHRSGTHSCRFNDAVHGSGSINRWSKDYMVTLDPGCRRLSFIAVKTLQPNTTTLRIVSSLVSTRCPSQDRKDDLYSEFPRQPGRRRCTYPLDV